ncbi:MAG TPA: RsmE family RNA methyltransferase [Bacteroidota bacterium]|nr:RsmE family RNA methyltransferase [Bacteroidota bacterium]
MDYFVVDKKDVQGMTLYLRGEESRHLSRVLRKRVGDHVFVTDGADTMYEAAVVRIDREEVECDIVDLKVRVNEPRTEVALAVSLLKNPSRVDFLVEKAVELGVRTIIPMQCERTIPEHEKHARLEKIALAAVKQCGRSYLPKIIDLMEFDTLVQHAQGYSLRLIPHEKTEQSQFVGTVMQHHPNVKSVLLLIGPEGGFTDREIELASGNHFIPISLGPRRLRTETAAISALSWVVGGW